MKLILVPEVKEFLKKNKNITKKDLEKKMYEEFREYPQRKTLISTKIKKGDKEFTVMYITHDNQKDIECLNVDEVDKNAMTIREYIEKMKKEKAAK